MEYDPGKYPTLLQPILTGKTNVVYGSRFAGHVTHRVLYFWHLIKRQKSILKTYPIMLNHSSIE
jgi:hypothetical protein